jgi:hypothetical protein
MGVIDKTIHKLSCASCNIVEEQSILDKGSGWSGSDWQSGVEFKNFNTIWSGGGKVEPTMVKAECKRCGKVPDHNERCGA